MTADAPNKAARDMLVNGFAPLLEQPAELEHAFCLGPKNIGRRSFCRRLGNHSDIRKGKRGGRQLVSLVGASWQNYYTSWRTNGKSSGDAVKTASNHEAECFTCSWPPLFTPAGGAHSTHMFMYTGLLSSTASIAKCRGEAGQLQVKTVRCH